MRLFLGLSFAFSAASCLPPARPTQAQVGDSIANQSQSGPAKESTKAAAPVGKAPESAEERLADYTKWLTIFTGLLVAVSAFQGYYIRRGDENARITAEAARDSAKAALVSQRAALFLSTTPTMNDNRGRRMTYNSLRPLHFANFGATPARITSLTTSCRRWGKDELEALKAQPPGLTTTACAVWLAGNGAELGTQQVLVEATDDGIARAGAGDGNIVLLGHLNYTDIFDDPHEVGFAYYMSGVDPVTMAEVKNDKLNYSR